MSFFFFLNDPAPTEIYPLSLHAALPILHYRGKQQIQDLVKRGLKNNLRIEQARDHRLVAEEASCWLLVTADRLHPAERSEEHTSELQSRQYLVCRLLLEKKKKQLNTCRK